MKVNVTLDDRLLERIDSYADENYMSRSGLISFACNQFLVQNDVVCAIKEMGYLMRKIADTGNVDEEIMKQLEDIERVCSLISKQ